MAETQTCGESVSDAMNGPETVSDGSTCVYAMCATDFLSSLERESVHLIATDPPYGNIVRESWDRQFPDSDDFAQWLSVILHIASDVLTPDGSLVFFGGIGKHGEHPFFRVMEKLEYQDGPLTFRNLITWKKRRAYGKSHDYLFCREEIAWYSRSAKRTQVRFNVPLTSELRGYKGFDPKYPAKSEYKRVSNVWDDIPELMRPERQCQKPVALMRRIIETHSHPGDLVVDPFAGWGTTGIACAETGRRFLGSEAIAKDAEAANDRVAAAYAAKVAE